MTDTSPELKRHKNDNTMTSYDYDYLVIGAGSGGISSAKRAASYGKKVAIIERAKYGGTCVNVGCVPKKTMFNAAHLAHAMEHDASHYCFGKPSVKFDYPAFKKKRDAYILRLNGIYARGLQNAKIGEITGDASFVDAHTIAVAHNGTTTNVTADKILIAVGGKPDMPASVDGIEHCISSDGFFALEELPQKAIVVGAGYIAVELAGVFNSLGVEVHLVVRKGKALRNFDDDISDHLDAEMQKAGITIHRNTNGLSKVEVDASGKKTAHFVAGGDPITGADVVLYAAGRVATTDTLNLDKAGVNLIPGRAYIQADEFQNTSADNIFAVGDVCGKVELTPMAIAAGRRLADRLFNGVTHAKAGYELVPTVVFSHPTIGTIGLTEAAAKEKYGEENIKIYKSKFANLYYGVFDVEQSEKPKTFMKVITAGETELVVGLHVIGVGADEMLQGFGVAMKMGCTKSDLDSCVAIHPTASEELVTMGTWGTAPEATGAKVSPLMGAASPEPQIPK
jgi:glutathione reductase (NADPH)